LEKITYSALNGSMDVDLVGDLKQLIPEFISMNSEYGKLDKKSNQQK
jgi:hypothetical protein